MEEALGLLTSVLSKMTEQHSSGGQEGQYRENRWESENPCYWCWKVGHLARWHKLDWFDSTSFVWSTNRKAWHVVQAMHRADKSPKAIMETLDVNVNLKAHNKGRDRLRSLLWDVVYEGILTSGRALSCTGFSTGSDCTGL